MNAIKELRDTTNMSQSRFATYLGIPVANIQHWEQGVTNPPNYVVSLITRVMQSDGYIDSQLTPMQINALRQTKATLAMEDLFIPDAGMDSIHQLLRGDISREEYQNQLRENYLKNEQR